jgi:hypothetical protein
MNGADNSAEAENLIAATIAAAEDIRDPLDGLVESSATDPEAPFAPDSPPRSPRRSASPRRSRRVRSRESTRSGRLGAHRGRIAKAVPVIDGDNAAREGGSVLL